MIDEGLSMARRDVMVRHVMPNLLTLPDGGAS
jgi:hypothetical protein